MAQEILNTPREVTHQRIAAALEAIEQNMSDEHEAVNIDYDNTYSGLSADNVQEAIDELENKKANTADLGTASAKNFTTSVTQGSNDLVTSGAVYNEFANLPKPEIFKGTLGVNGTIISLPTASSDNEGWEYKVITAGTYAGQDAKYGDTFISDGTQWVYIPSGDETDTDTWRGINVNGSQLLGNGISSGNVNFKSGTNAQVSGSGNDITVDVDTTFTDASSRTNIASGDSIKTILGKIKKWFTDLKTVAFTGKTSDLTNDSGFINTVDSAMSDSSTNPLQNKVITKELEGTKTATGNPLTIEDAAPVNAVNLSMDLEPIQDLHGYSFPWVGGAGKNKLPMTVEGIKALNTSGTWSGNVYTLNGVTFTILTDADGNVTGIKVNGTSNVADTKFYFPTPTLNTSVDYILSGTPVGLTGKSSLFIQHDGRYDYDNGSGVTFTITNIYYVGILCVESQTISNQLFYPMIRLSTETDSTFAPYTNICPISGRSEVAIQRVGKNLYPITVGEDYWDNNAGGTHSNNNGELVITVNNNNYSGVYSSYTNNILRKTCLALSNFTISADVKASANMSVKLSSVEVQLTTSYQRLTFGTSTMISIYGTGTAGTIYVKNLQLELGSTATTYEPYAGKTYTIQLGETVYGGQLDVTRGKMVVAHGEVDLGDLDYYYNSADTVFYSSLNNIGDRDNSMCSQYALSNATTGASLINGMYMFRSDLNRVYVKDTRYTDATAFKTAVTGQQLVYELATPFTIDLTPQQINLLENTNTIYTDYEGDTITLEYQPNNAIGEAVRAVEESYDPEFAVRPVLKKKAFSGTTDSDGAVTLINASDIPSGHKIIPLQITDMTIGGSAGTYFVEYKPYNSGDSVKGYCYTYFNGSQITPVVTVVTGIFYYYELEV